MSRASSTRDSRVRATSIARGSGARPAPAGAGPGPALFAPAGEPRIFLDNHAHVLACLARDPDQVLREVAAQAGITEPAVQRFVADLEEAGVLERERAGRRNRYRLNLKARLRYPLEAHCRIGELLDLVAGGGRG